LALLQTARGPCQRLQGPSADHLHRRSGMPGAREIVAVRRHSAASRPVGGVDAAPTAATGGWALISRRVRPRPPHPPPRRRGTPRRADRRRSPPPAASSAGVAGFAPPAAWGGGAPTPTPAVPVCGARRRCYLRGPARRRARRGGASQTHRHAPLCPRLSVAHSPAPAGGTRFPRASEQRHAGPPPPRTRPPSRPAARRRR